MYDKWQQSKGINNSNQANGSDKTPRKRKAAQIVDSPVAKLPTSNNVTPRFLEEDNYVEMEIDYGQDEFPSQSETENNSEQEDGEIMETEARNNNIMVRTNLNLPSAIGSVRAASK